MPANTFLAPEERLKFAIGNVKLPNNIATFSIPSGHSCPGAKDCLAKADKHKGKIQDGPVSKYRCFSASQEAVFKTCRDARWHNFDILKVLKTPDDIAKRILMSMYYLSFPPIKYVRIHVGGDFYSQNYFDAWVRVAEVRSDLIFYAYTKSVNFWADFVVTRDLQLPSNFRLTASRGGKFDHLIDRHGFNEVVVVSHPDEAKAMEVQVDHDDSHAYNGVKKFALVLHGAQPKGSDASAATSRMRKEGVKFGYSRPKPLNKKTS